MTQAYKIKLAAIAKDEGFYLPLWVYHHLHFGFDVIDIRVNDTTDNSLEILKKLKTIYGERLRFSLADQVMAECQNKGIHFQTYIYKQIYQETLVEDFTHLIFLDIDEYWCSADFSKTIKDFLTQVSNFDVCMFQWLIELPNSERNMEDFAFKLIMKGQKSNHVKSLLNLKAEVKGVNIHNYIIDKGNYILSDQGRVDFAENNKDRGVLPIDLHEQSRLILSNYFVFHFVFRSQDEYIASLLRGNKQSGGSFFLKRNRIGFTPTYARKYILRWILPEDNLMPYKRGFFRILKLLEADLIEASSFVLVRKQAVLDYLKDDVFLQQVNANKMRGIDEGIYQSKKISYFIKAKVNNICFDEQIGCCKFSCEVTSEQIDYELVITRSFAKEPVIAKINLLSIEQRSPYDIRKFDIEIDISQLTDVVYNKTPPFCLAARVSNELFLLEMYQFRELSTLILPKIMRMRETTHKKELKHPKRIALQMFQAEKKNFWQKLFNKG